ncbi:MAG: hypothetical protein R6X25_03400 [Candidatus Krumholzibacteriia bacterium]
MKRDDPQRSHPLVPDGGVAPASSPFVLERMLREAYILDGPGVQPDGRPGRDDLDDMTERAALRDTPRERAQELAFQALEQEDPELAARLARQALELDPRCVDALALDALLGTADVHARIERLDRAARTAEDQLGEEFFAEYIGDLWTEVVARPYLRALRQLAEALWDAGRRFDAVADYENLLELDQPDRMGNAVVLLARYLEMGEVGRSRDLLDEYGDRDDALVQWAEALVSFLEGDHGAAEAALARARRLNRGALPYLSGEAEPPLVVQPHYTPGSPGEADVIGQILAAAWSTHAAALLWLLSSEDEDGSG